MIDPVKVTKATLTHAASIAAMILTTDSAVVEAPAKHERENGQANATATATDLLKGGCVANRLFAGA
jgi:hypothetical protein